jgi:lysophospholipase L1-like esterase
MRRGDQFMRVRHFGFVMGLLSLAGCNLLKNPSQPSVPPNTVNYTALGASDTIGYGGSAPCLPLVDCTTGTGYVQRTTQRLQAAGKTVTLVNLGVPGAVLGPGLQAAGNGIGLGILRNLLDDESDYVPHDTTLVTLFIGGNDVNTANSLIKAGQGGANTAAYIQTQIQQFGQDLAATLGNIRGRAADAQIVLLNLPNMAAIPYAAGRPADERQRIQQLSVGFSAQIDALASGGVAVIDLMCNPQFYDPSIFSSDGFHPNDSGYAILSDLVYAAASGGAVPRPQASCGYMNLN